MPNPLRADPADLVAAGGAVDDHADRVGLAYGNADVQIEAALPGFPTASLAAMTAKASRWRAATSTTPPRLLDHAQAFRDGAVSYSQTDDDGGKAVDNVAVAMGRSLGTV